MECIIVLQNQRIIRSNINALYSVVSNQTESYIGKPIFLPIIQYHTMQYNIYL